MRTNQNPNGNISSRNNMNLNQSMQKSYTSVRHRASRSNSKDNQSPFSNFQLFISILGHQASVRQTSKDSQRLQRSNSKSNSKGRNTSMNKSQKVNFMSNSGYIDKGKKYCIFTTKERSGIIATTETSIQGRYINEQVNDPEELKYFIQDKFYHSVVSPAIRGFIEGTSASVILFGPTEGGKTYTLKGKTGAERGILPRAVEDIFNIVKNSEQRQEELEAINQRMMYSDEEDDGNFDTQNQRDIQSYNQKVRQSMNQMDPNVPERLFLKIQVYQIFVDKVLDLLNTSRQALSAQNARVSSYIDNETKEVVSKLANVTEKAIFNLEDFYSVLQEAFKNRRLESVSMQESDLRKKSHFIIGLTLMKRNPQKKLIELAQLNFVELSGSEQAVAEDSYYKEVSIRQFVTRSFNALSSQILRSALRKKSQNHDEGDVKLVNSIRNSLTQSSNIILICNVNPSPQAFHHSLPAIKFCARIRECIIKKQKHQREPSSRNSQQNDSINSIPEQRQLTYDQRQSYQAIDKVQILLDQIRDEVYLKRQRPFEMGQHEKERWSFNMLDKVDATLRMLYENSSSFDREKSDLQIKELSFLKDQINQFRYQSNLPLSPNSQNQYLSRNQQNCNSFSGVQNLKRENQQYNYNPHTNRSFDQNCEQDQRYLRSGKSSVERQNPLSENMMSTHKSVSNQHIYTEDAQDQEVYSDQELQLNDNHRLNNQQNQPQLNIVQGLRPHNLSKNNFQTSYQSINNRQLFQKGLSKDNNQENEQIYANLNEIQVYQKQNDNQKLAQHSLSLNLESGIQSSVHSENDFLNKANPFRNSLQQKQNSISEHFSPKNEDKNISTISQGFRANPKNGGQLQYQQQISQSPSQQSQAVKNPLTVYLHNQSFQRSSLNHSIISLPMSEQVNSKVHQLKQDKVYQSQQDALQDITRLIKLNDFEGLKLRVKQIFKEKEELENVSDEQVEIMRNMRVEIAQKEELIEEQDSLIRSAQVEFQATIDEFNQLKIEREMNLTQQSQELAQHMKDLQQKLSELEQDKNQSHKAQEILEMENRELIKLKEESDQKYQSVKEENDKLRSNYDILKEHEVNIIRDYEGKKTKEINFFEQRLQDAVKSSQDDRQKVIELEEKIFQLKEEYQRMEFELQKSNEDRAHLIQQVEELNHKIEKDQEAVIEIQKQMQSIDLDYQKLEEQKIQAEQDKKKAYNEINKLHMLVEEMDKNIQQEQQRVQDEIASKKNKEQDMIQVCIVRDKLEEQMQEKDAQLQQAEQNESEYKRQLSQLADMNEELERQLTKIKAKEYDKVDLMKKGAEFEARLKYYQVDNENLVRERNNLDIANVNLKKLNQDFEQRLLQAQGELEYFKQAHEMHLDKFDQKFDSISAELQKLKQENIQLKEKEKNYKRDQREILDEKEELQDRLKLAERRNDEMLVKLQEVEKDMRVLMQDREKDLKESAVKLNFDGRFKEENKHRMLDDIQNMIKQYKYEKGVNKNLNATTNGYNSNAHNYSTSSGYY
ncbi:low quality protein: centromere-associated protein e [Stylonychia lemnae]|uniref:Low quality protein: centromere-associated protein e n=1 Tax=Stylonychia lemnae TaxID=5949 RepID=A0A077ZYW8_STYLE|nr:low quality protein: centromere-associated protein e [Stylonychia lemnae]|eukprot:CDW75105.1 low quality protein: centromere-associated protein e [Stylonychia lemnae]